MCVCFVVFYKDSRVKDNFQYALNKLQFSANIGNDWTRMLSSDLAPRFHNYLLFKIALVTYNSKPLNTIIPDFGI